MKRILLFACLVFLLSGCATLTYNYHPTVMQISEPPLNSIMTVQVGDTMLRQGKYSEYDAIFIKQNIVLEYTLTRGYYLKQGENENAEFYTPSGEPGSGQVLDVRPDVPFQALGLDKKNGKLFIVLGRTNLKCRPHEAEYEKTKCQVASADSFQQTLIYNGKVGNKINMGYREFSNNMARPAFNNNVEYDLSQSKIIGYKGARVEVIEANNEYIKYRVIQNFNKAEQ